MNKNFNSILTVTLASAVLATSCKKPAASFTASKTDVKVNDVVTFTNTSTDAGAYSWDFGDGETSSTAKSTVTHVYTKPGTYVVTMIGAKNDSKLSNAKKLSEAAAVTIKVSALDAPVAAITASKTTAKPGEVITFTSTDSKFSEEFIWEFGDGSMSNSPNATHVYSSGGKYTVSLTTYAYNRSQKNTATSTITIANGTGDYAVAASLVGTWKLTAHDLTHTMAGQSTSNISQSCYSIGNAPFSATFSNTPKLVFNGSGTNSGSITVWDGDNNVSGSGSYSVIESNKMSLSHPSQYTNANYCFSSTGNCGGIANSSVPSYSPAASNWTIVTLDATTLKLSFTYTNSNQTYYSFGGVSCNLPTLTGKEEITETVTYKKQ